MKPIRSPYVLFFRLPVQQDPPVQPSRMKLTIRLLIATALLFASGCAKSDWIDRMLVTVDVTGSCHGQAAGGGSPLLGDMFQDLVQQGSTVKGTIRLRGTGLMPEPEPIERTVAGDILRFKNPRGTLEAESTVSGDEMAGTALTPGGRRTVSLQRVEPSAPTGPPPR